MPKYTVRFDLKLTDGEIQLDFDHDPTEEEVREKLDQLSGSTLVEHCCVNPPEVEVWDTSKVG